MASEECHWMISTMLQCLSQQSHVLSILSTGQDGYWDILSIISDMDTSRMVR